MARQPGTRDYRDGSTHNPESKDKPKPGRSDSRLGDQSDRRWWEKTGRECSDSISGTIQFLQRAQAGRLRNMVANARLYGNIGTLGVGSSAFGSLMATQGQVKKYATYNATQSGIDTLVSHIGETKPRPYYLTSGGNYKQQRQAKKLTQFTDGVFYETQTYRKAAKCFRDAAIWGDGFMHVFAQGGKLHHERVIGAELWVDEVEGQYGTPRNMSRVMVVDRDELAGYFPECRKEIMEASRSKESQGMGQNLSDMVTVAESWHLGSMNEKGKMVGGKVAMALVGAGVMLQEPEDWEHDFFPFARIPWCEPVVGYWAQGGCEQVRGEQMWLNELFWTVQKAMRLAGTIKVAVQVGSKIVDEHINNEIGAILKHTGAAPTFFTSAPVDQSFFTEMREGIERIYRKLGVSELSASNMKPAGLDSKPSLREYKDTQNERHKTTAEAYDDFFLQIAAIDRAMAKGLKGYKVRVPGASGFSEIDFAKDVGEFKDEEFILQCFPVSQLPRDPAGRTQTVQEWVQAGWLTPRQGRKLMDFPDLQAADSLANAQEELIQKTLDAIVDDGEYAPPEPTDDLALAKETCLHYIQLYRRLELDEDKLGMLRDWNSQVDMLMMRAMAPAVAPMAGPPAAGVPQASPMPAPQSQLLPQAA